ncbi:MAG: alpha/beta fold hydrolase [Lachnospiraceae bacterium]|nr:alpha/beta fold hydrolase [Lachnospiraceae bacterium]
MKISLEHSIIYEPQEGFPVIGVLQIVHGMCEHQKRYADLANFLASNGYVVITSDLRGHGDNIRQENELGFFGDNAVAHLVGDVQEITLYVKDKYKDLPYMLLGHSMGTLIATSYFKKYDNFIDGLFLSGMPSDNGAKGVAKLLIKLVQAFKGEYYRSKFINNLCNGPFAKPFKKEGSDFAWLANDPAVYEKYEKDPKCGFIFTLNGFDTLMDLMETTYGSSSWIKKNLNVPIRFMSGGDDPCMGNRQKFMKSVANYKKQGYTDVSYVIYPGQRHEIFNDTEKKTAWEDLLREMNQIVANKSATEE